MFSLPMNFPSSFSTEVSLSRPNSSSSPSQVSDQKDSPPIEEIILKITVKSEYNYYLVDDDNQTLLHQHATHYYLAADRLPARILNDDHHGRDLERYVAEKLICYQYSRMNARNILHRVIDTENITNQLICQWEKMREEVDLSQLGGVVPLDVTIGLCHNVYRLGRGGGGVDFCRMVPASEAAVEEMLKRIGIEEIREDDWSCVICLEEMTKEEEEKAVSQLPCRHTFHEDCIKKWLKNSHYCPNCRFQIPTK